MIAVTGSSTRKYATASTRTVTLSRVIPSCAGIGIVTICMLTFCSRSTIGITRVSPGSRTFGSTLPNRNTTPRSNCRTTRSPAPNAMPPNASTARIASTMSMCRLQRRIRHRTSGGSPAAGDPPDVRCRIRRWRRHMLIVDAILAVLAFGGIAFGAGLRVVRQFERGVVFRFGRVLPNVREPGLTRVIPMVDRLQKVNMQIVTMPIPAQDGITRDNVTVRVDAVAYFRVLDPVTAIINVQDYLFAVSQVAQTSLRSIIGKSELDDLLSRREALNQSLEELIDSPAVGWGIHLERVEIKDVALPEGMKRSMSRQAEAERERRARIITAEGEFEASKRLAAAANVMARDPAALQLRLLQTVVEVAAEKNSTLVMPIPGEIMRFFDKVAPPSSAPAAAERPSGDSETEAIEPFDTGDAEVAAAEAAIER